MMDTCDHHLGAIAIQVSGYCNLFVQFPLRECIQFGSLVIAIASTRDSFHREGPPTECNRSCRLRPTEIELEIRRR